MKGSVDKIWENETNGKKKYHVVDIGGERYSVWDHKLIEGLTEGSTVEYDWQKSGDYKKITDMRKIDLNPDLETYRQDRKSIEIIRMSCIKSACQILQGTYKEADTIAYNALTTAREFEKYVTEPDKRSDFPDRKKTPDSK